jgi:MFS family permease
MSSRLDRGESFVGVAYAFAVTMLGTTLPTPLYPIYEREVGFSGLVVTVIFATYAVGVIAALLLFGQLSDRIGRRRMLLPGLAFAAASSIVFLLADALAPLLLGRVLSGLSAGIFTGTATAALVDLAPEERRGRATLVATAVNLGGLGLGPLLAGILAELAPAPLRLPYVAHLALLLPAGLAIWLMTEPAEVEAEPAGVRLRPQRLHVPAEMRGTFVRATTAAFAAFATLGLFSAIAPAFLGELLGLPNHALTGVVVFAAFAASTIGQLGVGRIGGERALPGGCVLMIAGMGLIASGLAASSLALLVAGAIVAGLGNGLSFRAGLAEVNAESPVENRGEVASSFFVVSYLALSIPIVGIGVAAQAFGLRAAGLAFSGFVALLALVVLLSLARRAPAARRSSARTR